MLFKSSLLYLAATSSLAITTATPVSPRSKSAANVVAVPISRDSDWHAPLAQVVLNGVTLNLEVDTGSSDTYVHELGACAPNTSSCDGGPDGYKGYDKIGFTETNCTGEIKFADDSGVNYTAGYGPMELGGQQFIANFSIAHKYHDQALDSPGKFAPGFMEMEHQAHFYHNQYRNVVPDMVDQGLIHKNAFGMGGDEMVFGGYDRARGHNFRELKLIDRYHNGSKPMHWDVSYEEATLFTSNGSQVPLYKDDGSDRYMVFDTGLQAFGMAEEQVKAIWQYLGAKNLNPEVAAVRCDNPDLDSSHIYMRLDGDYKLKVSLRSLVTRDVSDKINAKGKWCILSLNPSAKDGSLNSLGGVVLEDYYLIFDVADRKLQIGELKNADSATHDYVAF